MAFLNILKKEEGVGLDIILKPKEEDKTKQEPLLADVQQLLDQLKNIFNDGALSNLLPQRSVCHQIHFIPGSLLPKHLSISFVHLTLGYTTLDCI